MNKINDLIISVIIPTYKPQDYIFECLQSLENQYFDKNNYEVIIILNGEYDPYYSLINNFLKNCHFFYKFFYTSKASVSYARNIGIEKSNGMYLTFIDDDDIVSENYLQGLYNIAKNGEFPLSYIKTFTDNISNSVANRRTYIYEKNISKNLTLFNIRSYFSIVYCKLINRELIGMNRFDENFQNGEDSLFMFAISKKRMNYQFTDRSVIYYRRKRKGSLCFRHVSYSYKLKTQLGLAFATMLIFLKKPNNYDILFFLSRVYAYLRGYFI